MTNKVYTEAEFWDAVNSAEDLDDKLDLLFDDDIVIVPVKRNDQ